MSISIPSPAASEPSVAARPAARASLALPVACALGAGALYNAAFASPALAWLVVPSLWLVLEIRRARGARAAFWCGTLAGAATLVPRLAFLWDVFGIPVGGTTVSPAAPVLWTLVASFHGVLVLLVRGAAARWGTGAALALAPVLWMGTEHVRAEGWWLRFPWLTPGEALDAWPALVRGAGVYGAGALALGAAALAAGIAARLSRPLLGAAGALLAALVLAAVARGTSAGPGPGRASVAVAGLQLEAPTLPDVLKGLDATVARHPAAELVVLGEYTLEGEPPAELLGWCRANRRWLVVGGTQPAGGPGVFRNTAFVVGPTGEVAFTQAKAMPIQFFRDGLPAASQRCWESPWGRIGIAVCYDAGYRAVMDPLVRDGAGALLVIAMDAESWGAEQHRLNERIARLRGLEYGLPLLRVATSGHSVLQDASGAVASRAGFPGQGETVSGVLRPSAGGRVPPDARAARGAAWATGLAAAVLAAGAWRGHARGRGEGRARLS